MSQVGYKINFEYGHVLVVINAQCMYTRSNYSTYFVCVRCLQAVYMVYTTN